VDIEPRAASALGLWLAVGGRRFDIRARSADSCLIVAGPQDHFRGSADIYEGDRHIAQCLIVLAEPEGGYRRLTFKRCTPVRQSPARDFAPDSARESGPGPAEPRRRLDSRRPPVFRPRRGLE
jgi:hypothetical protein